MSELCPTCLQDLNRPSSCEKTTGGLVTEFLLALKDDVATWPQKQSAALRTSMTEHIETVAGSNLVMANNKRMFKIQCKKDSAELKYGVQGESGSRSFKATLEIFSPSVRAAVLGFMAATINQEMVILCKTRTGDWHLLGDADEGAEYDSGEATTGKAGSDANGATITFAKDVSAPTIYKGDTASLTVVGGTAATIVAGTESVSGTTATVAATATSNDSTITKVGFRYRKEGDTTWTNVAVSSFTSGTEFTKSISSLTAGDYLFYGYAVVDGQEIYTETKAFTIAA